MAAGAGMIAGGLCLLALSPGLLVFWAAWVLIGIAGAMFLTTSAYAYIADYAGDRARSLIGTLRLVTGLAGSVFWPITAFLDGVVGWRATVLARSSSGNAWKPGAFADSHCMVIFSRCFFLVVTRKRCEGVAIYT
jgi:MFS family permease